MPAQLDPGAADVAGDEALGVDHVAARGVDDPAPAGAGQGDEGPAVVGGGVPQPGDRTGQLVDAATRVAGQVELAVELQEAGDVAVLEGLDPLLHLLEEPDVGVGEV